MSRELIDQIEALVLETERKEKLKTCLAADNLESEPSPAQNLIFKSKCGPAKYIFVQGGNQSINSDGYILMADGSEKSIRDVKEGDLVFTFDTTLCKLVPSRVVKHWYNGFKEVSEYEISRGRTLISTPEHEMVCRSNNRFVKRYIGDCTHVTCIADIFEGIEKTTLPNYSSKTYYPFSCKGIINVIPKGFDHVYDLTVDHPDHNYICNGIIVGNSGKTSCAIRDLTWTIQETHPYWERPGKDHCNNKLCGNTNIQRIESHPSIYRFYCPKCQNTWEAWEPDEPMTMLLVGQNNKNLYLNLWLPRIKPLLTDPQDWHEVRIGPYIGWVEHRIKGHRIIFYPHGHGGEKVRQAVQGFTIHAVYLDELAPIKVIEELQRRVDSKLGYFFAAFTMKTIDAEVARYLKAAEENGSALVPRISKFDNPKYSSMRDEVMRQIAALPKSEQDKILYGTIEDADDLVFKIHREAIEIDTLPPSYSPKWRHVEIVDPAQQSTAGYMLCAQDPDTKIWYMTTSDYIKGMQDPLDLVDECITRSISYNIVRRISDNMAWFTSIASKRRDLHYITPPSKQIQDGKVYTIKRAQTFLSSGRFRVLSSCEEFWDEVSTYRWKEGSRSEIIHASKYHVLDCFRYFVDCLPRDEVEEDEQLTWMEEIRQYNDRLMSKPLQGRVKSPTILSGSKAKGYINKLTKGRKRRI